MAPQDHPHQHVCKGVFLWTASSDGTHLDATCYGIMSPLVGSYVDLLEHTEQRTKPAPDTVLHNLQCWGSAVYQHHVDPKAGAIPPPACLGVEFQRYRQAAILQSSASASGHAAALHQEQHLPAVARDIDIELLHADQHVSTSSASHPSTSSSTEAYMRHAGSASTQSSTGPSTSSSSGSSEPTVEGLEYHGRPSVFERFRELHAEASERLDGKDPLWFGKAFAARAALNWDSMKNMAGEALESAKADLGLSSSKSEESD